MILNMIFRCHIYLLFAVWLSLYACTPAPPKNIDRVWLPTPRDARPQADDSVDMGGGSGGDSAGGDSAGGSGEGGAGSADAGFALAGAGAEGGREAPQMMARGVPTFQGSALVHIHGETRLAWAVEEGLWLFAYDARGERLWERLIPRPEGISAAQMFSANLRGVTLEGEAWLLASVEGQALRVYSLSERSLDEPLTLPLEGRAEVVPLDGRLLISGLDRELGWAAWLAFKPREGLTFDPEELKRAPVDWPAPDSLGLLSGRALLRFNEAGQCVALDEELEPINSTPCLTGEGVLIGDGQTSYLTYIRPGQDSLLVNLSHQPDLAASYEVLSFRTDTDGLTGQAFPPQAARRAVVGVRLSEESDGALRDRLIFVEADGLWVSEEGWDQWPYEGARLATRYGQEGWLFIFDEQSPPELVRVPLKVNEFRERLPFGFSTDEACRPSVELCDQLDNNCDGIEDNGLCCAPFREPIEATFRPLAPPTDFYVTDGLYDEATRKESRFVFRTGERRWEPWSYGYAKDTLDPHPVIEGAHEGLGWSAAGEYTALVARDDDERWSVFWTHRALNTPFKGPEVLGCERPLTFGVLGSFPTETNPIVVCDDRIVHLKTSLNEETGELNPNVTHESPLAPYPPLEWATISRHFARGTSSVLFAFESLSGGWEVNKLSLGLSASELTVQLATSLSARLGYGGEERPSELYLHRDEAPGIPGNFPVLQLSPDRMNAQRAQVRVHLSREGSSGGEAWRSVKMGADLDEVRYAELQSKVIGSRRTGEGEVSFWVVDLEDYEELNLWSSAPTFVWRSALGAEGVDKMRWDVIHGDYINYIALLSPKGEGVWAITLYSVKQCDR